MTRLRTASLELGLPYLVNDHVSLGSLGPGALRITNDGTVSSLVGVDGSERLARSYLAFFS